jgi:hypothetical protein
VRPPDSSSIKCLAASFDLTPIPISFFCTRRPIVLDIPFAGAPPASTTSSSSSDDTATHPHTQGPSTVSGQWSEMRGCRVGEVARWPRMSVVVGYAAVCLPSSVYHRLSVTPSIHHNFPPTVFTQHANPPAHPHTKSPYIELLAHTHT